MSKTVDKAYLKHGDPEAPAEAAQSEPEPVQMEENSTKGSVSTQKKDEEGRGEVVPIPSEQLHEIEHDIHEIRRYVLTRQISGPFPPAEEFAKYNQGVPGAADRILTMAEREQVHTHQMNREALEFSRSSAFEARRIVGRGQFIALGIGIAALGVAVIFATLGAPVPGAVIAVATIAGLGLPALFQALKKRMEADRAMTSNRSYGTYFSKKLRSGRVLGLKRRGVGAKLASLLTVSA